jgi:homoserine kinase
LIPEGKVAAGKLAGAVAVALSGAGPSVIAFASKDEPAIGIAMHTAFNAAGLEARIFQLAPT